MESFTRVREANFRRIFGRVEIDALMDLFRSMVVRYALPRTFRRRFFLRDADPWPQSGLRTSV